MPRNRPSNARPTLKVLVPALLALGCVSEDTAIEVALEVSPSIDDATLATADTMRVANYNPDGDGPRRGSNRSRDANWEVDLTIGDPSPACVRNSPADPPCATATWQLDLGLAFTAAGE